MRETQLLFRRARGTCGTSLLFRLQPQHVPAVRNEAMARDVPAGSAPLAPASHGLQEERPDLPPANWRRDGGFGLRAATPEMCVHCMSRADGD